MAYRNFGYNYHSTSNHGMVGIGNVGALVESIKPDINSTYNSAKNLRTLFIALIPVCMILFMGGGMLLGMTGSDFGPNLAMLPILFLGFFGFGACGALTGVFANKAAKLKLVIDLKNEIEARDKTNLDDLSLSSYVGKNSVILIINKLIETGNLKGYEVVGDVGVARTELRAKERDFVSKAVVDALQVANENMRSAQNTQKRYRCPGCGAPITEQTGKFCTFCGVRLE